MVNSSFIPVSDVIKTVCLREGDSGMSMAAIYASYMPSVYNDLRFNVTKRTTTKKFYIDPVNNSLVLPNDCLLLVAVGYLDSCNKLVPLWYNSQIPNKMLFENPLPCNCDTCGEETNSCSAIKSFDEVTEVVTIDGDDYTNYVKTIILTGGKIIKETREWGKNDEDEIIPFDTKEEVCTLETLPCGCIATTPSNTEKIESVTVSCCSMNTGCGSYNASCCDNDVVNSYKVDVQDRLLILSPSYDKNYVVLKYWTAITSQNQYQIPTIALEAVIRGIKYYRAADDPKQTASMRGQNSITHRMYTAELNKVRKRLNPLNFDKIMDALGVMSTKKQTYKSSY